MMVMQELTDDHTKIAGIFIPGGMLNIVMTDKTAKEITDLYKEMSEKLDDIAPVIIFDPRSEDACFDMCLDDVDEMIEEFEEANNTSVRKQKCTMTLNELLDKTSRVGVDALTKEELSRLEYLSNK
jgi:hypothetical protein